MRSMRRRPRKSSRTKLGATQSFSRAASATSRAWSALTWRVGSVTVVDMAGLPLRADPGGRARQRAGGRIRATIKLKQRDARAGRDMRPLSGGRRISFGLVRRALGVSLVLLTGAAGTGAGQLAPPGAGGVAALVNSLNAVGADKRVLMIGAHPDDEDTELL